MFNWMRSLVMRRKQTDQVQKQSSERYERERATLDYNLAELDKLRLLDGFQRSLDQVFVGRPKDDR